MSDAAEQKDSRNGFDEDIQAPEFGTPAFQYEWHVLSAQIIEASKADKGVTLNARQVKVLALVLGKVSLLLIKAIVKKWQGIGGL
jgi:hypothetical protein